MNRIQSRRRARVLLPYVVLWGVLAGTLVSFAVYEVGRSRAYGLATARTELESVSRLVSEHAFQLLNSIDRTLTAVRLIHERRLSESPLSLLLPAFHGDEAIDPRISMFDREGRLVASSSQSRLRRIEHSIVDRVYFTDAREHPGEMLRIGAPVNGGLPDAAVIPLVRRLRAPGGEFDGVLLSAIDPLRLIEVYRGINLGDSASVGLVRSDGVLYARNAPLAPTAHGVSLDRLLAQTLPGDAGVARTFERRTVDGVPMLVAYQTLPGTTLLAFASLAEEEALAEHHRFARNMFGFSAVVLAALTLPLGIVSRRAVREMDRRRELEMRYETERQRARSDPLTGAANRAAFDDHLERCNRALGEQGTPFVLAFIDLDRFKALNDARGHVVGDDALRRVARTLLATVRSTDLVARFGGDEFAVLMPGATAESSPRVCGKLHAALLAAAATADLGIDFSIGVVAFEQAPAEPRVVTELADRLMYDVKSAGGAGVRYGVYRQDGLHLAEEVPP